MVEWIQKLTDAIGDDKVINPEGLRYEHEFVRHKTLDAVGDLALAGLPLLCKYRSVRGGHRLNAHALKALFEDETAWAVVQAPRVRETVTPSRVAPQWAMVAAK